MELERTLSGRDREITSRVITKVGTRALRTASQSSFPSGPNSKYNNLASELSDRWISAMQATNAEDDVVKTQEHATAFQLLTKKQDGVRSGFRITGSVVEMTLEAYKNATAIADRSVDELIEIQKHPLTIENTILMLARKPNEINKRFEESLCLNEGSTELAILHGDIPFRIIQSKDGIRSFVPDIIRVIKQQGIEVVAEPERPDEQCPAQRFLPLLWNSMVDICANDPRYYQADLGTVA